MLLACSANEVSAIYDDDDDDDDDDQRDLFLCLATSLPLDYASILLFLRKLKSLACLSIFPDLFLISNESKK